MVRPARRSITFTFQRENRTPGEQAPAHIRASVPDFSSWDEDDQIRLEMGVDALAQALGFRVVEKVSQWKWTVEVDDDAL